MFKAGCRTIRCEIHKLINSIWNKEEMPEDCEESIIVPIYKNGDKIIIRGAYHFYQIRTKFYSTSCCQS